MFILQIVVQPQALDGQVLANNRHAEVPAIASTMLNGERVAENTGLNRQLLGLAQQVLPGLVGQSLAIPVCAGVFASMIEKADIVIPLLQWLDLVGDELVDFL